MKPLLCRRDFNVLHNWQWYFTWRRCCSEFTCIIYGIQRPKSGSETHMTRFSFIHSSICPSINSYTKQHDTTYTLSVCAGCLSYTSNMCFTFSQGVYGFMHQVKTSPMKLNLVAKVVSNIELILCLTLWKSFSLFPDTRHEHWRDTTTDDILSEEGCQVCADGMYICKSA